ncbi:MAG: hypothetical protein N2440_05800 [Actinobacteria bacterium]|nr:hypothetical protein [Actinomycetota bacterium]
MTRFLTDLKSFEYIVGADEVGRGCLAGPLVSSAVLIEGTKITEIIEARDSKQQNHIQRKNNLRKFISDITAFSVVSIPARIIDEIGVNQANRMAIEIAVKDVLNFSRGKRTLVIVDHINIVLQDRTIEVISIPKADAEFKPVSLASTLAKVLRDLTLSCLEEEFSQFSFSKHKGYGTHKHLTEIEVSEETVIHRKSFRPIQQKRLF